MKVHLHQIPQGGTLLIEGEEDASFLGLEEADAKALSPVRYTLDVGVSEAGFLPPAGWRSRSSSAASPAWRPSRQRCESTLLPSKKSWMDESWLT